MASESAQCIDCCPEASWRTRVGTPRCDCSCELRLFFFVFDCPNFPEIDLEVETRVVKWEGHSSRVVCKEEGLCASTVSPADIVVVAHVKEVLEYMIV